MRVDQGIVAILAGRDGLANRLDDTWVVTGPRRLATAHDTSWYDPIYRDLSRRYAPIDRRPV